MRSGWSLRAAKSVSSDKNVVNVGRTSDSERRLDLDDSDGISGIKISATTLCDCTYMEVWPKDTIIPITASWHQNSVPEKLSSCDLFPVEKKVCLETAPERSSKQRTQNQETVTVQMVRVREILRYRCLSLTHMVRRFPKKHSDVHVEQAAKWA